VRPQRLFRIADVPTAAVLKPACWPKVPHKTRGVAEAHLRALQRTRTVIAGELLTTYTCRYCGSFHV